MEISLSLSLTGRLLSSSPATALFSVPGSRGFFYDFSDYSTQFQDTAGTTAITGVGQSLGLVLDKSAGLALGPELVTNGGFASSANWLQIGSNVNITGGALVITAAANNAGYYQPSASYAGSVYEITVVVTSISSGAVTVTLGIPSPTGANCFNITAAGTYTFRQANFTADTNLRVYSVGASTTASVDSVSVRSIPGNHATQATAGSRALTQVRPMFTQRNRAVGSELPENVTYWPTTSTVNGVTSTKVASGFDVDGLPYVDVRYQGTATATFHDTAYNVGQSRSPASIGQAWTSSVTVRRIGGSITGVSGITVSAVEETAPFTFVNQAAATETTATADTLLTATRTIASGNQARTAVVLVFTNGATIDITYRIKGLQLELGSTRTTYQPAVSGELRNLLTFTEQFDNAAWLKSAVGIAANSATAPDGTLTADTCTPDTTTAAHLVFQTTAVAGSNVQSIYVKANGYTKVALREGETGAYFAAFDLSGGGSVLFTSSATATITAVGDGWFRLAMVGTLTGATRLALYVLDPAYTTGSVIGSWTPNGTNGIFVWGAQVENSSTYSRYQRTITTSEWYEPGFTSYRGLRFDGTDDFLQTAAIDFAGAESLGTELVTNGDFSVGTGWTLGTGVTISGGVANLAAGSLYLERGITTVAGRSYKVTATASNGAFCGAWDGANQNSQLSGSATTRNGTFSFTFTANDTQSFIAFTASGAGATTIDNVSVREVLIPADKMTVVAGVRKLSDAAIAIVTELTINSNTENGSFYLTAPQNVAANFGFASKGTIQVVPAGSGFPAPITAVQTGVGDISGDVATLRINGSQVAQLTSDQGTGNFANAAVYIGRRAGSSLPFNGVLTFLCVINRTLTASELAQLETFANSRTGAY